MKSDRTVESFLSREASFLVNNFLLLAVTAVTLWGVVFPVDENSQIPQRYQGTMALHPTQLYMSLNGLLIFLVLLPLHARKTFDGQVFYVGKGIGNQPHW